MCLAEELEWLPPLMTMADYGGDWNLYVEALYECFARDFLQELPPFCGLPMRLKRHPLSLNKEATFWHLISEGKTEADRLPCLRRCARLCWVRPMIDAAGSDDVFSWVEDRPERAIIIAVPDFSFKVVIARRSGYFLPWTAYHLEHDHQRERLRKQYSRCERI